MIRTSDIGGEFGAVERRLAVWRHAEEVGGNAVGLVLGLRLACVIGG